MLARMPFTSPRLALCLVLSSACGGGGSSEAGGGSSSTAPTTGGGSSESGSSSAPTTSTGGHASAGTGSSGGLDTSGSGTTTTDASATTTGAIGTSSGSASGGTSSGSTGASSTGEPVGGCVDVSGDYGPCDAVLGYGFDGTSCRAFSGCDCAPHCDDFAPDPVSCATSCAAAGECNDAAVHPAGINKEPPKIGSLCDEVDACTTDAARVPWLKQIFARASCEPAGYPCDQGQTCHVLWQGTLDAAQWAQICAASLLPGADLQCVVWGP